MSGATSPAGDSAMDTEDITHEIEMQKQVVRDLENEVSDYVLRLSCFWIDVDGGEHLSWKFVLSGQEYAQFLMEPMRKLENARQKTGRKRAA
jgi:hypothetical protein